VNATELLPNLNINQEYFSNKRSIQYDLR
jgi:hypothetical protein